MTAAELAGLRPGDVIHRTVWPSGCSAWEVDQVEAGVPPTLVCVYTRRRWTGGGAPILRDDDDLSDWHRASDCPADLREAG